MEPADCFGLRTADAIGGYNCAGFHRENLRVFEPDTLRDLVHQITLRVDAEALHHQFFDGLFTRDDYDANVDAFEGVLAELYDALGPVKGQDERVSNGGSMEQPVMSTQVDDLGNLVFKDVPVGTYLMIVHLSDAELVIEGLAIG